MNEFMRLARRSANKVSVLVPVRLLEYVWMTVVRDSFAASCPRGYFCIARINIS